MRISDLQIENLSPTVQIQNKRKNSGDDSFRVNSTAETGNISDATASDNGNFFEMLKESIDKVNEHQYSADLAIKELISGRTKNVHETMLAVERADVSLKLMMQVRNKIIDAYKEVMKMQV